MKLTRNDTVLGSCVLVVTGMLGLSYAAVPLYDMFCRATGYGGTPARADSAPLETSERTITVRFDSGRGLDMNADARQPMFTQHAAHSRKAACVLAEHAKGEANISDFSYFRCCNELV